MAGANSKPCHRKGYLTVEINQIRYFLALCAERNFSRAALRCGVAQPTVTIGIKALERDLGGQLFYRNHRRAALTPLGEAMLPHLTRAMQAIDRARAVAALNAEQLTGRDELLDRGDYSTSYSEP
jgi:DNA-binding transcriptional LysR family regulator